MKAIERKNKMIIYKATNENTSEVYIGSTTTSLDQRKHDHQERAKREEMGKFHEAIHTYGENSFTWETIDTADDVDELALKEQQHIKKLKATEEGYNSDRGGGFKKSVHQYCKETGIKLKKFNSLEEAANEVNSSRSNISSACLGSSKTAKGFYWSYKEKDYFKVADKRLKGVTQKNINGEFMQEFKSIAEASRQTGIGKSCIAKAVRGERQQAGGYLWIK
jgi:group I intron endonuclease